MLRIPSAILLLLAISSGFGTYVKAQTATYHLHKEVSSGSVYQLKAGGPDGASLAFQSANLKNLTGEQPVKSFETPVGVPGTAGIIPAGSTVYFTLYMRKTANYGTLYPHARLHVNSASGPLLISATGWTELTTTVAKYTFLGVVPTDVPMAASDRFHLRVGTEITAAATTNTYAEVSVEGTLDGNYDSQIVVPLPNYPPTVSLTSPQNGAAFSAPAAVTLSASAADSDGTVTKVEFFEGSNKIGEDTSSPYGITWNAAAGSYPYSLTAVATDNFGRVAESAPVTVTVSGGGSLTSGFAAPSTPRNVDLTAEGTADWVHWGLGSNTQFDRKSGVTQQISNFSRIGPAPTSWLNDNPTTFSWTDGEPTSGATGTGSGVYTNGVGNGFELTVPADASVKTLKLFLGVWCARGKLEAVLSDSSALAYVDSSLGNNCGTSNGVYTINFKASSAGQTLRVRYTVEQDYQSPAGKVSLAAATLAGGTVFTGSISNYMTSTGGGTVNLTAEGTADWAHWGMGWPFQFDRKRGAAQQIGNFKRIGASPTGWLNDNPTPFSWTDGTPTASATDTRTGTFTAGTGNGFELTVLADTRPKVIKFHTGVWYARARLEASLSDNSAPPVVDTTHARNGSGASNAVYTIKFRAASAGQTLRVRYTVAEDYNAPYGNVAIQAMTLTAAPTVFSLTPSSGPGGRVVVISGEGFGPSPGSSTVTFNGVPAQPSSWSDSAVSVPVPAGATSGPVIVKVGGMSSNGVYFRATEAGAPSISYVYDEAGRLVAITDPAGETARYNYDAAGNLLSVTRHGSNQISVLEVSPDKGGVGQRVTIYGTGFGAAAGQNTVTFNGVSAPIISASPTRMTVSVPSGATSGPVAVTSLAGTATSDTPFVVEGSSGPPVITGFTPAVGRYNTSVVISGANFGASPALNRLDFNTSAVTPATATATSLSAVVPYGTTSGRITVTTPAGTAVSASDFFMVPDNYLPESVEITGRMQIGGAKRVAFTQQNKIALILFDGVAGQQVSLRVNDMTSSYNYIAIRNPDGTTLAGGSSPMGTGLFVPVPPLPATGTYVILVDIQDYETGSLVLELRDAPDVLADVTPGGPEVTAANSVAGQNIRFRFNGTAGRRVLIQVMGNTFTVNGYLLYIFQPDGRRLLSPTCTTNNMCTTIYYTEALTLPVSGLYTVLIDPKGESTGEVRVGIYDVPPDDVKPLSIGGPAATGTATTPGQNIRFPFQAAAGQRLGLKVTNPTFNSYDFAIYRPDMTAWYMGGTTVDGVTVYDLPPLAAGGTYTPVFDPSDVRTGSVTASVFEVADVRASVTFGGPAANVALAAGGQNAYVTFSGTAGQRVSVKATGVTIPNCRYSMNLRGPDNVVIDGSYTTCDLGAGVAFIDTRTLGQTGTHTIFLDPDAMGTGSASIALYEVPPDVAATTTLGGSAVPISITVPGRNAGVTFSAAAGESVTVKITSNTMGSVAVYLIRDNVATITSLTSSASSFSLPAQSLPAAGTYRIFIDPVGSNTGSLSVAASRR